jgi:hypothetical protein
VRRNVRIGLLGNVPMDIYPAPPPTYLCDDNIAERETSLEWPQYATESLLR